MLGLLGNGDWRHLGRLAVAMSETRPTQNRRQKRPLSALIGPRLVSIVVREQRRLLRRIVESIARGRHREIDCVAGSKLSRCESRFCREDLTISKESTKKRDVKNEIEFDCRRAVNSKVVIVSCWEEKLESVEERRTKTWEKRKREKTGETSF